MILKTLQMYLWFIKMTVVYENDSEMKVKKCSNTCELCLCCKVYQSTRLFDCVFCFRQASQCVLFYCAFCFRPGRQCALFYCSFCYMQERQCVFLYCAFCLGRGKNVWISPEGSLSMSMFIDIPIDSNLGRAPSLLQTIPAVAVARIVYGHLGYSVSQMNL